MGNLILPDYDDLAVLDFWPDGAVNEAYYQCWYPNTLIMGPYGSGKSKTTAAKLLDAICMMPVSKRGSRQSKVVITRNYEADLLTATLDDWKAVFPGDFEDYGKFTQASPSIHALDFDGHDGIPIECEVQFLPLNNIKEANKKLKGQEYTYGWWNEAAESSEEIVNIWRGRIGGRMPAHHDMPNIPINAMGDRYWSGAFFDTNPPDDEHWVHQIIEAPTPAQQRNWRTFVQPPGAIKNVDTNEWEPNPLAENTNNLSPSYYTQKIADALSEDWVRINLGNQYGTTLKGVPVWSNYSQTAHETKTLDYDSSIQVGAGLDYGRTPAMSMWQKRGDTYLMFDEFTSKNMSAELFGPACRQWLWDTWKIRAADVDVFDDPAGGAKSQATEDTPRQIMRASGFTRIQAAPCEDNNITVRRKAMTEPLGRLSMTGKACVQIHHRCKTARSGAAGKFYFRKLEVSYDDMYSDKPVKNHHSHLCFAHGTQIDTPAGKVAIELLKMGDLVDTPIGPRRITCLWERNAERVKLEHHHTLQLQSETICTPDHPFWTKDGYVRADELVIGAEIGCNNKWWSRHFRQKKLGEQRNILSTYLMGTGTTLTRLLDTITGIDLSLMAVKNTFIELFGLPSTGGQCPKTMTYTTKTKTRAITSLTTLNVLRSQSTWPNTYTPDQRQTLKQWAKDSGNGMPSTVTNTQSISPWLMQQGEKDQTGQLSQFSVSAVLNRLSVLQHLRSVQSVNFVLMHAQRSIEEIRKKTMQTLPAQYAAACIRRVVTARTKPVVLTARKPYSTGLVVGITVDDAHAYYANGMLVSNCEGMEYYLVGQGEGTAWLSADVKPKSGRRRQAMIAHNRR